MLVLWTTRYTITAQHQPPKLRGNSDTTQRKLQSTLPPGLTLDGLVSHDNNNSNNPPGSVPNRTTPRERQERLQQHLQAFQDSELLNEAEHDNDKMGPVITLPSDNLEGDGVTGGVQPGTVPVGCAVRRPGGPCVDTPNQPEGTETP